MRLGGFRIIILPGNGLVKVKKLKVLKKFPKKSGINLDMSFNYFCHLKLTCLFLKPSKGHVYIYIYIRKKLFLTQVQSKNNISLKVLEGSPTPLMTPVKCLKCLFHSGEYFYFHIKYMLNYNPVSLTRSYSLKLSVLWEITYLSNGFPLIIHHLQLMKVQ